MVVRHASCVNNVESGEGSVLSESLHRASLPSTERERRLILHLSCGEAYSIAKVF